MNTKDLQQRLRENLDEWEATQDHTHRARLLMAESAETLELLAAEVEALLRGEFICKRCGLRKDAGASGPVPF